jgi:hypothetical protein
VVELPGPHRRGKGRWTEGGRADRRGGTAEERPSGYVAFDGHRWDRLLGAACRQPSAFCQARLRRARIGSAYRTAE